MTFFSKCGCLHLLVEVRVVLEAGLSNDLKAVPNHGSVIHVVHRSSGTYILHHPHS
jgi:hypothetical protein